MRKRTKVVLTAIVCVYVVTFTSVNIADLKVGFDYDDTLIFSTPAFRAGAASGQEPYSPEYWRVVNQSFNREKVKLVPMTTALIYKALGFDVVVITARQGYGGVELQEHWKWLAKEFYFERNKSSILEKGRFVAFFGDSDSDITEALEAGVKPIRVKRGKESDYKGKYHPGQYNECILPFSD
jgi:acid phosphatase class B